MAFDFIILLIENNMWNENPIVIVLNKGNSCKKKLGSHLQDSRTKLNIFNTIATSSGSGDSVWVGEWGVRRSLLHFSHTPHFANKVFYMFESIVYLTLFKAKLFSVSQNVIVKKKFPDVTIR